MNSTDKSNPTEQVDKASSTETAAQTAFLAKMSGENDVELKEIDGLTAFIRGAFHNIGNIVNTLCISAETALEIVEQLDIKGVGEAGKLLGSFDEALSVQYDDRHPLRLLPTYLSELSNRISEQRERGIAELQVLIESAENIRENLRFQQNLVDDAQDESPVEIGRIVDRVVSLHQNVLKREHIRVEMRCEDVPSTRIQRRPLIQVLTNLIVNSKHAMQEVGGERVLSITVTADNDRILITVRDSGIGIRPSAIERLFEQGFTTKSHGSGIGLFISRQLVESLGGSLTAKSDGVGKGAAFIVSLPVVV